MDDMGYCPKCQGHSELDKKKNRGFCQFCYFFYCIQCNQKYHPFKRCKMLIFGENTDEFDKERNKRKTQILD